MPAISAPETTEIYREASLSLVVKPQADAAALSLLKDTVYGTKGVRYRQTNQEERLRELYNPFFFHLYEEETLLGVYCLDHRVVEVPWGWVDSFYGRYLAVTSVAQGGLWSFAENAGRCLPFSANPGSVSGVFVY
ncbi:hypothetical protein BWI93_17980 [Siphonobacter sp. BAB-5385]|uniref:hypothetical protein n=1 Tax=Siphonobacter sp. BAB-5385 TaxID=1864822 RepID=UPI000BCE357F|nr:hypothetical protein [Siphonobacter sp. BAB-5385]OZI06881.1 hypothetical protein BWI93_17980 [Siphonobacter sp. BAB-5385]